MSSTIKVSKKYTLNQADFEAIGRGLLIALAGAALTYLIDVFPQVDFGQYQVVAAVVFAVLVNVARKYLAGK
jgi:hypothetical protein